MIPKMLLMGQTASGKTTAALRNLRLEMDKKGKQFLFISDESTKEELYQQLLEQYADVAHGPGGTFYQLRTATTSEQLLEVIDQFLSDTKTTEHVVERVIYLDTPSLVVMEIYATLQTVDVRLRETYADAVLTATLADTPNLSIGCVTVQMSPGGRWPGRRIDMAPTKVRQQ